MTKAQPKYDEVVVERRIKKARADLMSHPRIKAMNPIMVVGETRIAEGIRTAMTDGFNEAYDPHFVMKLTPKALNTVVGHENLHKFLRHTTLWAKLWDRNPHLANICADFAVNIILYYADKDVNLLEPPEDNPPLLDERVANWSAGRIFQWCIDKAEGRNPPLPGTTVREWAGKKVITLDDIKFEGGGGGGKGKGKGKGKGGGGNGDQPGNGGGVFTKDGEPVDSLDQHQIPESGSANQAGKNGGLSPEQIEAINRAVESSQLMSRMGTLNTGRMFDQAESRIDWTEGLRDWFRQVFTGSGSESWVRPHRRYLAHGIYLPTTRSKELQRILVATDTSGSIVQAALSIVLARIHSLVMQYQIEGVDLMYWDSEVVKYESYNRSECKFLVRSTKPEGGGGTDPGAVHRYVQKHRSLPRYYGAIVFTDGYTGGEWGQWDFVHGRVLWIIEGDRDANPTVGKVLHRT